MEGEKREKRAIASERESEGRGGDDDDGGGGGGGEDNSRSSTERARAEGRLAQRAHCLGGPAADSVAAYNTRGWMRRPREMDDDAFPFFSCI